MNSISFAFVKLLLMHCFKWRSKLEDYSLFQHVLTCVADSCILITRISIRTLHRKKREKKKTWSGEQEPVRPPAKKQSSGSWTTCTVFQHKNVFIFFTVILRTFLHIQHCFYADIMYECRHTFLHATKNANGARVLQRSSTPTLEYSDARVLPLQESRTLMRLYCV